MSKVKVAKDILDLRRGIDHIGVSIACIVHDGQGKILLMKRGPKARDERGNWDVLGGAVEFGEAIEDTIRREAQEELCTGVMDIQFITAYDAHREHDGKPTHWIALVHTVLVKPNKVKIGEPHKISEIGWFTSQNLPSPRHSQFDKSFKYVIELGLIR